MIKIPGTAEGVGAIEQAIYEGINVNVTLLFAVSAYAADRRGLHPRPRAPRAPRDCRSTSTRSRASSSPASTRTSTSASSSSARPSTSRGTAALANARAAYSRFKEIFSGPRWEALADGRRRRPAAAVGFDRRQEPGYPDTLYVDNLIAAHTVNTMPPATLAAVADHGTVPARPPSTITARTSRPSPPPASTWTRSPMSC